MKHYIKLIRPHHWIKNFLIFLPLVFSGNLFKTDLLILNIFAFASFSFMSSVLYIINDIKDVEQDRKHSKKCKRPIASGAVSIRNAVILAVFLFVVIVIINAFVFPENYFSWLILLFYFIINLGYSMGLKNLPIIDVSILVIGFLLRVVYGSLISDIEISGWLYFTVMSMSYFLGFGKRRNEIQRQTGETRKVLRYYTKEFLDKFMYLFLCLTIAFYSFWTVDAFGNHGTKGKLLYWTVPLVIIICMKYSLDIERDSDGDPVDVVFSDWVLFLLSALYGVIMIGIIYLPI